MDIYLSNRSNNQIIILSHIKYVMSILQKFRSQMLKRIPTGNN